MSKFPFESEIVNRRQNEYAVIIYLPDNLDRIITPFREKYDPIYKQVSSHITLTFPFQTSKALDDLSDQIKSAISGTNPFAVELESINDFYPKSPVIFWSIKENKQLCELYYNLYSKLEIPIPHKKFIPHVTLAREISFHRVEIVKDSIASYLPSETFFAEGVDLVTPLADFKWVSVRTFGFDII